MVFSVITMNSNCEILTKNLVTFRDKMGLRIWKIQGGGEGGRGVKKIQYIGWDYLNWGLGQFRDLSGGGEGVVGGSVLGDWQKIFAQSFLLASDSINPARATCITFKWLAIISLDFWSCNAGGLSMSTEEKLLDFLR